MTPFYESPQRVNGEPQVRIFHGRWEEVWPTLGLKPSDVALCWADPPYGVDSVGARGSGRREKWRPILGDKDQFDPSALLTFPRAVLWGGNHYASRLPDSSAWWVWDKKCQPWECSQGDGESAWTNLGGPMRIYRQMWQGDMAKDTPDRVHPTQKPVALAEWGFQRAGLKPGDLVFSPYLGSGPEVRAALNLGLRIIGCEVDADYCRTVVEHRVALAAPRRGQEGQALLPL